MKIITEKLIESFTENMKFEEKSYLTIEKYARDIRLFYRWVGEKAFDKSDVLNFKAYLTENYAPSSVNSMLSSVNSFFEFNKWYGLKVKSLKIQKCVFADNEKELSKNEYSKLLAAAKDKNNDRLYFLMQTICASGLRVSELKYVTVAAAKSRLAKIKCKGKIRQVFLPDKLCRELLKYAKARKIKSGSIFVTSTGKPLDRSNIWKLMKSLCERANVDKNKVFPHNLRHLFARTFYAVEKDIVRLADILGHSSVNTTRIYTMETWEICRRQVQSLGLIRC